MSGGLGMAYDGCLPSGRGQRIAVDSYLTSSRRQGMAAGGRLMGGLARAAGDGGSGFGGNADSAETADLKAAYSLTCRSQCTLFSEVTQRPSSMVYTVKVHLQRTLADLMFPPHCQSGRG